MSDRILRERYQIIEPIGKGGFGQTFRAKDLYLPDRPDCVIKQLKNAKDRVKKEEEALRQLGIHTQIPTLFDYFEEEGETYLVQEFIDGHDLSKEIIPGKPWDQEKVINLLREVLNILVFVHKVKQIHRDIKPANLIRRKQDNKVVLIDFGVVKDMSNLEGVAQPLISTMMVGTREYIPNEQAGGKPRYCSDIYSLGIVGIEALTGIAAKNIEKDYETDEIVWHHLVNVNLELRAILDKMVLSHFCARYQSAQDVLEDLNKLDIGVKKEVGKPANKHLITSEPEVIEVINFPLFSAEQIPIIDERTPPISESYSIKHTNNWLVSLDEELPKCLSDQKTLASREVIELLPNLPILTIEKISENLPDVLTPIKPEISQHFNELPSTPTIIIIGQYEYEIIDVLGSGVWHQTYLVKNINLSSQSVCVLKRFMLRSDDPFVLETTKSFLVKQIESLKDLDKNRQIQKILDYCFKDRELYIVYQFIEGDDLSKEISPNKIWSAAKVFDLMREILEILKVVHQHNIIHLAINPSHLIRRKEDNKLVLIDFGNIKQIINLENTFSNSSCGIGANGYIPKEQIDGNPNFSSDVYAIGIIGIQALTGLTAEQLQQRKDNFNSEITWQDKTNLIQELEDVLCNMVRDNFQERPYKSAKDALDDGFNKLLEKWLRKGNLFSHSRQLLIEAISSYDKITDMMPDFYRAWYQKGEAFKKLGDCKKAFECFEKAVKDKPDYFKAWSEIGYLQHQWEDYKNALRSYAKAIEINHSFHKVWYYKGLTLHQLKSYEEALECYRKAIHIEWELSQTIEINPESYLAWCASGDTYAELHKYVEALDAYEKAIGLKITYPQALHGKAKMLEKLEEYEKAIEVCNQATRLYYKDPESWYLLGRMAEKIENYEGAITAYEKALKINPCLELAKESLKQLEIRKKPKWMRKLNKIFKPQ